MTVETPTRRWWQRRRPEQVELPPPPRGSAADALSRLEAHLASSTAVPLLTTKPTDELCEELGDLLWFVGAEWDRESTEPGSRFEGEAKETVQARATLDYLIRTGWL